MALQDADKNVRIAAANVLGAIRHHDACDALVQSLEDKHVNVRYAAVEALSRIPSQKSVIPLTQVLEHDEDWLKLPAISALGHIGDYRATPYLIKIAEHPLYLQTGVEALGNIGDERGIPCIIKALASTDIEIRKTAIMSMERMARKLDKLHAIIQRPITYQALFRAACTEQIMLHLIELTEDTDFNLVVATIKLLGWSGRQDAAYALLEKLGNEQYLEVVVSALIYIGEDAITPLANAYETSRSLENKLLIIDCLREIGGDQAFQILLTYLATREEELIVYAILKSLTNESFLSRILEDRSAEESHYFEDVLQHVKDHLDSAHPLIRAEAVYLWGRLLGRDVLDYLFNATKDVDPTIRIKAIEYLGKFIEDTPGLIDHLILLLSDNHPNIRKQVAYALGNTDVPEAFPALLLVLDDSNAIVQQAAVAAVGVYLERHPQEEYRQKVLEKLADVLEYRCRRYEDGLLKIEICHTLEQIESDQSKELLLKLSHDVDFDVRKMAILAFGSFQEHAEALIPILLGFLQDAHWSVREAAVTALGALHADSVETVLLSMLDDDPDLAVRKALLMTLGRIGSPAVIATLVEHLAHDELDDAAYQGLALLATHHREQIISHNAGENPKVHLYLQHIIEGH